MRRTRSRRALGWLAAMLVATAGCDGVVDGLRSHAPRDGSESARRWGEGPHAVVAQELELVDASRPTMANGDVPASAQRRLAVTVRTPLEAGERLPLVVYSHGFNGNRAEMAYLLEHLASHGAVVASLDFPLTHGEAPGGVNFLDLASQPGDVRFVIDTLLAPYEGGAWSGHVDPARVGLAGLSYGGLTTTLLAFHPSEADPRVGAAVSIAGPSQMFTADFFAGGGPPFLMIAGSEDAFVPHDVNAAPLRSLLPAADLLTIEAATHLGFTGFAATWLRFADNPDATVCEQITDEFEGMPDGNPFAALGGPERGIHVEAWERPCQRASGGHAMRPQQQHWITAVAVRAFFDAHFAAEVATRDAAARYLREVLPTESPAVSFEGS